MNRPLVLRMLLIVVALFAGGGSWSSSAAKDETSVTVTMTNAGSLTVGWITTDHTFLVNGREAGVSSSSSAVAAATFSVAIADTRADGARDGYSVVLSASTFSALGTSTPFSPSQLAIESVAARAGSDIDPTGAGESLSSSVEIIDVAHGAPAIDTTLTITISLAIPAGTMPGTYRGTLTLEVIPAME